MDKQIWTIAGIITTVFLVAVLALTAVTKSRQTAQIRSELTEAQAAIKRAEAEAKATQERLAESQAKIGELEKEKEAAVQSQQSLEDEMRSALESRDVTISQLQGKLTVNILDRVMFDSGEAQLKPDGEAVLRKVAKILAEHPELKIHVIGHTDNVPIRASARNRFPSNWELSTARAAAVVKYFVEEEKIDPKRFIVSGYGEFKPRFPPTPENRAKNRRVEIIVMNTEKR